MSKLDSDKYDWSIIIILQSYLSEWGLHLKPFINSLPINKTWYLIIYITKSLYLEGTVLTLVGLSLEPLLVKEAELLGKHGKSSTILPFSVSLHLSSMLQFSVSLHLS